MRRLRRLLRRLLIGSRPTGWGGKPRHINRILLAHRSNRELAKLTVYTAHRTPDEIADEILWHVQPPLGPRPGVTAPFDPA